MSSLTAYQPTLELGFMGDGVTSSNDFQASMNFAAVHKASIVFVRQNNQWSISMPVSKQTRSATIGDPVPWCRITY